MSESLLLAGDIGGTKTRLALYDAELRLRRAATFASARFPSLEALLDAFLDKREQPVAAAFGVAGPVQAASCRATNLPWHIETRTLATQLATSRVSLLNDLEATAEGARHLPREAFHTLQEGQAEPHAPCAVIAAGTGLGMAIIPQQDSARPILPSEGGHVDFAPNDDWEDGLLRNLRRTLGGHVSLERVLSGPGLVAIYTHLRDTGHAPQPPALDEALRKQDAAQAIGTHGITGDPLCREALRRFATLYGRAAGNLALTALARGGVIVAGGIAPKILPALIDGAFLQGFLDKGRFRALLEQVPVRVALDPDTPLLGAAQRARALLDDVRTHCP